MEHLERNFKIIKERMIEQMENSLKLGKSLIDSELDAGMLNFVVKPIIKGFYEYWSQHDARYGTLKQIQVTLNAGKEIVLKGGSEEQFLEVFDNTFLEYLKGDQTHRQCSKRHKNYGRMKQVARETYFNYLKQVVLLLQVEEQVQDYGDLCTHAFKTKDEAKSILLKQLEFTNKAIQIVEEDPSILNVPIGKKIILKALRKGFEESKQEFIFAIDETY